MRHRVSAHQHLARRSRGFRKRPRLHSRGRFRKIRSLAEDLRTRRSIPEVDGIRSAARPAILPRIGSADGIDRSLQPPESACADRNLLTASRPDRRLGLRRSVAPRARPHLGKIMAPGALPIPLEVHREAGSPADSIALRASSENWQHSRMIFEGFLVFFVVMTMALW